MNTLILTAETSSLSIAHLLKQVDQGGVEVRNEAGQLVAIVMSPSAHEELAYDDARRDILAHQDNVRRALARRGGVTTAQLLERAATEAAKKGK